MKRFVDEVHYSKRGDLGVCVVCPNCEKMGMVKYENGEHVFKCHHCFEQKREIGFTLVHKVENQCQGCERFFRVELPKEKHQFKVLNVNCPHCNTLTPGKVQKINKTYYYGVHSWNSESNSVYGFPLYFLDYLGGKPIWALNREHLQYLIDYIEADLREKAVIICPSGRSYRLKRGASYQLPTFMKLAKNRDKVLKILRRMQAK